MRRADPASLWGLTAAAGLAGRFLADAGQKIDLRGLQTGTTLSLTPAALRGRSVLIYQAGPLATALALAELDGVARRIVLCPVDLAAAHLPSVIAAAGVDTVLSAMAAPFGDLSGDLSGDLFEGVDVSGIETGRCGLAVAPLAGHRQADAAMGPAADAAIGQAAEAAMDAAAEAATEWLLFTSGTTGRPKMVVHDLASLSGALALVQAPVPDLAPDAARTAAARDAVWSSFYDIRRYGGLQILLRALLGGGSMVLADAGEPAAAFLARAGRENVTHISGTPSHWRRALMSPACRLLAPRYIRLSGEVVDQAILDQLRLAFPAAGIAHAFASTEAGVAFDVGDGLAGFPAALLGAHDDQHDGKAELRVENGSLRIRSRRTASRYANDNARVLLDADGFVDTGDLVELRGGRYYFAGRAEGLINVGGLKVHPEEVEAAINLHPAVRMSWVRGRASPITGALVVADVVLAAGHADAAFGALRDQIIELCRAHLPPYKVPALLRRVSELDLTAAGKLRRRA